MSATALVIMAKEPRVGSTKTRLCPPLKPVEATGFYEALLLDTIERTAALPGIDLAIAVTPADSTPYFTRIAPPHTILVPVDCRDIGECLYKSLDDLLGRGYSRVMALNSDGPSLPNEFILQAAERLDDHDLVFGPSDDGGYYLIGLKEVPAPIFTGIEWSTAQVLSQTLEKCAALGLGVHLLPEWYDVDTADDIERLHSELSSLPDHELVHSRAFLMDWMNRGEAQYGQDLDS
jgi:rSAM/selenodomain-associated transferase 1